MGRSASRGHAQTRHVNETPHALEIGFDLTELGGFSSSQLVVPMVKVRSKGVPSVPVQTDRRDNPLAVIVLGLIRLLAALSATMWASPLCDAARKVELWRKRCWTVADKADFHLLSSYSSFSKMVLSRSHIPHRPLTASPCL